MVNNYKQTYQKIKVKQLQTLLSNIKSIKQFASAEDDLQDMSLEQIIDHPVGNMIEGSSSVWFIKMIES